MKRKRVNLRELRVAVEKFHSLRGAIDQLEKRKLALEAENSRIQQENECLQESREKLLKVRARILAEVEDLRAELRSLSQKIVACAREYELFCSFMAMVAGSPTVSNSIDILIAIFRRLKESGWALPKDSDEMRSVFVRTVLGDYLKCFRCDACGTRFIVNQKPRTSSLGGGYACPVCYFTFAVRADDAFLRALVSKAHLQDIQRAEMLSELEPLRAFLGMPCEICGQRIRKWDEYNAKLAVHGIGCAHTACWKSESGQMLELARTLQKVRRTA